MPPEITVDEGFQPRHFLTVLAQQLAGAVIDAEILIYALALDIGVFAIEIYHGMAEIAHRCAVAAECTSKIRIDCLLSFYRRLVEVKLFGIALPLGFFTILCIQLCPIS